MDAKTIQLKDVYKYPGYEKFKTINSVIRNVEILYCTITELDSKLYANLNNEIIAHALLVYDKTMFVTYELIINYKLGCLVFNDKIELDCNNDLIELNMLSTFLKEKISSNYYIITTSKIINHIL